MRAYYFRVSNPNVRLRVAAQVAFIIICMLLTGISLKSWRKQRRTIREQEQRENRQLGSIVGLQLSMPGIDWSKSQRSVVIVMSTACHFCTASSDFYKRLVAMASQNHVAVVAVFPQSPKDISEYLNRVKVPISTIRQMPLADLHTVATPTLMTVDSRGQVTHVWIGKLQPSSEAEVIYKVVSESR